MAKMNRRLPLALLGLLFSGVLVLAGCDDMGDQPEQPQDGMQQQPGDQEQPRQGGGQPGGGQGSGGQNY